MREPPVSNYPHPKSEPRSYHPLVKTMTVTILSFASVLFLLFLVVTIFTRD